MDTTITTLLRESNPPGGQIASPVPQYYDLDKSGPARVEGYGGAPSSVLVDRLGNPISQANPLEVRVRELERLIGEIATTPTPNTLQARLKELADRLGEAVASPNEHTLLARLKAVEEEVEAVKDALTSGNAKVTLTGQVALLNALSSPEAAWRGWGATVGTYAGRHPAPLDVSGYPRRLIHVRNNTNAQVTDVRLHMYGVAGEDSLAVEDFPNIPSGATLVIDGTNSEIIDKPYPYISLRTIARNATEGAQYVTFLGGV